MESKKLKTNEFLLEEMELVYRPKFKISMRPQITKSVHAYDLFLQAWNMDQIQLKEEFKVLFINQAKRLLGISSLCSGGITSMVADLRLIFATALKANAVSLIIAHNHPSGSCIPSKSDIDLTRKIREAGKWIDIELLDHLIITSEGYLSMADEGLI